MGESEGGAIPQPDSILDGFFQRQLAEIYLLLDNLSTAKEVRLPEKLDYPIFKKAGAGSDAPDWIQQIAEIHYPPDTEFDRAENAAKLYRARDALNAVAAPASSMTIAYTLLATRSDDPSDGGFGKEPDGYSRVELEKLAFPGLIKPAERAGWYAWGALCMLILWIGVTTTLSWYTATGTAILQQVTLIENERAEILANTGATQSPPRGSADEPSAKPGNAASPDAQSRPDQVRLDELGREASYARDSLGAWLGCKANLSPARWFGACKAINKSAECEKKEACGATAAGRSAEQLNAEVLVAVLAKQILPVFYGVLGAAAAVMRYLWRATRDYELSPRDPTLSAMKLVLGALMGATIGLFISPDTATASAGSWLTDIHLTASALSFVAGFGVEAVFQTLENLLARVFGTEGQKAVPPPTGSKPA